MEKLMGIFRKLIEANRMVKEICPSTWREQMKLYRLMIADEMKNNNDVLFSAITLTSKYSENDNTRLWLLATAVEMINEGDCDKNE